MSSLVTLPRVITEPLGGSKLSVAVQRGEIPGIGLSAPRSREDWRTAAAAVRGRFDGDAWLRQLAPALGNTAELPMLQRAAKSGIVVTTGQQAGLFGGHMLTLVKALSARALADAVEQATGIPCATIFWAATDDADFAEAASVKIPGMGAAETLTLTAAPPPGTPMATAPIAAIASLLERMNACGGSAGAASMEVLHRTYRDGETIGGAYVALLRELLGPLGIAVLDASHGAVARASRPIVQKALVNAAEIERKVAQVSETMRAAGFKAQVESVPGLSLVFVNERGIKRRLSVAESGAASSTESVLTPNVLLRPIVEAAILPTVAYVAGPGEIAYFAQIPPIADVLHVANPVAVPRWSATVIEPGIDRILERYGVDPHALREYDGVLTKLARDRMPSEIAAAIGALRGDIDRAARSLMRGAATQQLDPKPIEGLRAQLALRVDRGERRLLSALKHRDEELRRDLGSARASLYPDGERQERALSFMPFVARYGAPLIEKMLTEARKHADVLVGSTTERSTPPVASTT